MQKKRSTLRRHRRELAKHKRLAATSEFEEIVNAIRGGKVDAFVTKSAEGHQVLILQGAEDEHPYRILVESVTDGTATLDPEGTVLYSSHRLAKILGIPIGKLVGRRLQEHVSQLTELLEKPVHGDTRIDVAVPGDNGKRRTVRFAFSPVKNSRPPSICVVATELTELVEAKGALISHEESLRQISARLLRVQDEERRHIARDLHDVTGQKLAMQSMALSHVLAKSGLDEESRRALSECANLTKQVSEEIRTLSYMLHPPLLDELGLASGVKWYVVGFERRTGIAVEVDIPRAFRRLPPDVELTFFRIVQESLTNVHRYSGSTKAFVRIRTSRNEVRLEVGDFGKGMRPALLNNLSGAVAPVGVGIQGMRGRMLQLSGKLEITSRPNKGTVVTAILPISKVLPAPTTAASSSPKAENADNVTGERRSRKRILIADDHETLRRGLRTMLQEATDWDFYEAVDGRDAVNKSMEIDPDLVILDINMPVLNGLVAARQILSHRPQTRILMFTVHDSDHIVKEIEAAGAHAYLSKNKAGQELVRTVKDLLSEKKTDGFAVAKSS